MKIQIVVDNESWILPHALELAERLSTRHSCRLARTYDQVEEAELTFLLGCIHLAPAEVLRRSRLNLVVHESDLPRGRGHSPLTWQVLEGKKKIPICLFEAVEECDAGDVYLRDTIELEGSELVDELRAKQAAATCALVEKFVTTYPEIQPSPQSGPASSYSRRTPKDSRLDPDKTIREQFNLLRVVDNAKYPAFFELNGRRYVLRVERDDSAR